MHDGNNFQVRSLLMISLISTHVINPNDKISHDLLIRKLNYFFKNYENVNPCLIYTFNLDHPPL